MLGIAVRIRVKIYRVKVTVMVRLRVIVRVIRLDDDWYLRLGRVR